MKISYHWLSQYIDHQLDAASIASLLTNTGLEVEEHFSYTNLPPHLDGLLIGQVTRVEQHPKADKLKVTRVDLNQEAERQIICGAPNVAEGQKVVVAPVGTTIRNTRGETMKVKKTKIRDVESQGMIVSENEIGLGDDQSGIMVMNEEARVGQPFLSQFPYYEDQVFEIGLTPNRSDAASHIGVARDLSACLDKPIHYPDLNAFQVDQSGEPVAIHIQDENKCPRYSGLVIDNVQVEESPDWLKNKLKAVGLNPVNNVVDITNFVMQEWGQPLHAFDFEQIQGKEVIIQTAPKGQSFTTLDGENRTLEGTELMICDTQKPIAMAGIMGGTGSGINDQTTTLFLESAYFDPVTIRRASKRHQLITDASFRFERGTDPSLTVDGLKRAALLIRELTGGRLVSDVLDHYPHPVEQASIKLNYQYLDTLLGQTLPREQIRNILERLGFSIEKAGDQYLNIQTPTYRVDVTRPADVAEEIIRIYSLDAIEVGSTFNANLAYENDLSRQDLQENLARYLTSNGFLETIQPPFTGEDEAQQFPVLAQENTVQLVNPLSQEQSRIRKSTLLTGLKSLQYNINRDNPHLRLFEFGRVYWETADRIYEGDRLSLFLTGEYHKPSWYQESREIDFYYLKALVQNILYKAGVYEWNIGEDEPEEYAYNLTYYAKGRWLVDFGSVKPTLLKGYDIQQEVLYANFDFDTLNSLSRTFTSTYEPISKFPFVARDLSIKIPEQVRFQSIKDLVSGIETKLLKEIRLFDFYQGEHIEAGYKSYAFRMVFQDREKTLKDKEVDKIMKAIMDSLEKELGATIRK